MVLTSTTEYLVDTSFVKKQYWLGKNPTDRGRKATKVSLLIDGVGTPIEMAFHPANKHDCCTLGQGTPKEKADSTSKPVC